MPPAAPPPPLWQRGGHCRPTPSPPALRVEERIMKIEREEEEKMRKREKRRRR
jgi:hypothetical protein